MLQTHYTLTFMSSSEPETSAEEDNEEEDSEVRPESLTPEELEKLKEAVDERKKLIQSLRGKPWPMKKKLITLRYSLKEKEKSCFTLKCHLEISHPLPFRESQEFVEKYEGALGKGKGRKLYVYKVMMTKARNH